VTVAVPVALDGRHTVERFRCTEPALESWLKQRALKNQSQGASRCFVVCDGAAVVGYYALSAGAVVHAQAPGSVRRNMPDPIPVVVLGRLAVHTEWTGKGIGAGLLKDAVLRSLRLASELGVRAMLCHAIGDDAKAFYLRHGFVPSPIDPMTLMLNLTKIRR
jgi:predicted N-acetyltransferase YhbS